MGKGANVCRSKVNEGQARLRLEVFNIWLGVRRRSQLPEDR